VLCRCSTTGVGDQGLRRSRGPSAAWGALHPSARAGNLSAGLDPGHHPHAVVQRLLRQRRAGYPALFARYFDARLLDVPRFRRGRVERRRRASAPSWGRTTAPDESRNVGHCVAARWCVVAAGAGGIYGLLKERWPGKKNVLRRTCTAQLWAGPGEGRHVEVWGYDSRQRSAVSVAAGRLAGGSRWPALFSPAVGSSARS
jgi:hypothetical protein